LSEDQNQIYDAAVSIETVADPCPACNARGIVIDSSQPVVFANPCTDCHGSWNENERRSKSAERISAANIPSVLAKGLDISINRPEILQWMEAARGGVRDLFLYGPPGTGKSVLAVAILAEFLKVPRTVFYLDAVSFVRDVRKCHNSRHVNKIGEGIAATINEIQRRLRHFEIVVIDNLGRGSSITEFTLDTYSELVERRHETGKLTIWISNHGPTAVESLDGKTLSAKIGEIAATKVLSAICIDIPGRSDKAPKAENVDFSIVNFRARSNKMSDDESTLLHLWSRLGLFRLISHQERSKLTRPSAIDPKDVVELHVAREFFAWGGYHVMQNGPACDFYDCAVLVAVLKLYHHRGKGGIVAFSLAELAAALEIKSSGAGSVHKSLKRSLNRLVEATLRIKAPHQGKLMWAGGFIDSLARDGDDLRAKVVVRLNEFIVGHYRDNAFSYLQLPSLVGLRSFYAQGIYRFLSSHRDQYKFISLTKWREILGVGEQIAERELRRKIRLAISEMTDKGLLTEQSHLNENDVLHTYLVRYDSENSTLVVLPASDLF
jgi:DNA replication protein DnaC